MVRARSSQQVESYASKLEMSYPELKKFFAKDDRPANVSQQPSQPKKSIEKQGGKVRSSRDDQQVKRSKEKQGGKTKRPGAVRASGGRAKLPARGASRRDTSMTVAHNTAGTMRHAAPNRPTKPKVVICLGDHIIDTETEPSLIQLANNRKRPVDTLPDYFDPSVRPSVPTNSQQIYIPGNKVYARWLNRDDPGSYGTWYPGFIYSSKINPVQDEYNSWGMPNLLYHVKFDDGAESYDLDTEDIIMKGQYQAWLQDLEQYYSIPVTEEMTWKRLAKNTRVYAKWMDPTDPELHSSWMAGSVHSSKAWEGDDNQWRHSYHVFFDNGDQDEDLPDDAIIEEELYRHLLREKMERGRKRSRLSGFDLITEASKISSPIKTSHQRYNGAIVAGSTKKKLYSHDSPGASNVNDDDDDMLVEELRCNEQLEARPPSPTHVARISSTPSPDVHYGIYMKSKPWDLKTKAETAKPEDQGNSEEQSSLDDAESNKPIGDATGNNTSQPTPQDYSNGPHGTDDSNKKEATRMDENAKDSPKESSTVGITVVDNDLEVPASSMLESKTLSSTDENTTIQPSQAKSACASIPVPMDVREDTTNAEDLEVSTLLESKTLTSTDENATITPSQENPVSASVPMPVDAREGTANAATGLNKVTSEAVAHTSVESTDAAFIYTSFADDEVIKV